MAVLTGRSGQLFVDGTRVARCTGWSLDETRPMLDVTPVDSWDAEVIPGRRSGTGTAKVLYDPTDAAAGNFFDSILLNEIAEVPISLLLDSATGEGYPVTAHVSSVSHAVARGEAQMRDISFRLSDVGIELEIIGSNQAAIGVTQLYTGAVYGIDGAWTYLWTSSGPTIANPTAQTTNITFDTLGTYTLTLTATLGLTVLTDTHVVEVISIPLMWISRSTSAKVNPSGQLNGTTAFDAENQYVYHSAVCTPDPGLGAVRNVLSRLDYFGTRTATKQFNNFPATGYSCSCIQPLSNGDLFLAFDAFNNQIWMRVSADLSTILWQRRMTGLTSSRSMAWGCYDESVQRLFFLVWLSSTDYIGYVDVVTGSVAMADITPVPATTLQAGRAVKLSSGNILFVYGKSDGVVFMECNNDLLVGGLYAAIKIVDHTFAIATDPRIDAIETDNYIAVASSTDIGIFNKADYSHVRTVRKSNLTGPQLTTFYRSGEIVTATSEAGVAPVAVVKINEALTTVTSAISVGPTSGGATSVPVRSVQQSPGTAGESHDEGLGIFAFHQHQQSFASGVGEMVVFCRVGYEANNSLAYGPFTQAITLPSLPTLTALTLSFTANRTYSFAAFSPPVETVPSVSIADETSLAFQSYILPA